MGNKTTALVGPNGADDPALIRAQIAETRQEMSGTIEELHGRLNPTVLKEQAVEQFHEAAEKVKAEIKAHLHDARVAIKQEIRDATIGKVENMVHKTKDRVRETRESAVDLVRDNPIPAALTGIGLVWLLIGGRKSRRIHREDRMRSQRALPRYEYEYDTQGFYEGDDLRFEGYERQGYEHQDRDMGREHRGVASRVGDRAGQAGQRIAQGAHNAADAVAGAAHSAKDAVAGAAHTAREAVAGAAHRVGDVAADIAHGTRERAMHVGRDVRMGARRVRRRGNDLFRENPLAVGLAMVAVGTAVGMALPRTRVEDKWMGSARDRVLDRAQEAARGAADQVISKASDAVQHLGEGTSDERMEGQQQTSGSPANGIQNGTSTPPRL